jgi:pyruvate,water dikinase
VLVTQATSPGWAPLLLSAGALVTEIGGTLSHGAIIAREYGLPAVLNVADATRRIRDGQLLRVDGIDGTVQLLENAEEL